MDVGIDCSHRTVFVGMVLFCREIMAMSREGYLIVWLMIKERESKEDMEISG